MKLEDIRSGLARTPMHRYDDLAARSSSAPPRVHGAYSWWQSPQALPGVPATAHPTDSSLELLYVGIAPANASSQSSLRKRLANHHRSPIGSSTFRRTLTAFLWELSTGTE